MNKHVPASVLEAYVIGALDDGAVAEVEEHVLACRACEARLQHEASLEIAFTAVARHEPRKRSYAAPISVVGGALAMAAAMILWVLPHGSEAERPQSSEPPVLTDTMNGDASTVTASLDLQADGSRVGVRD